MAETVRRGRPAAIQDEQHGAIIWQRLAEMAEAVGLDPRLVSQIGRLRLQRKLTDAQAAAADKIGHVYGRFEAIHGRGRSARSPSYLLGHGGAPHEWDACDQCRSDKRAPSDTQARRAAHDYCCTVSRVEGEYQRVLNCIPALPRETREAVELLCVENCSLSGWQLRLVYAPLNQVALEFDLGQADDTSPLAPTRRRPPSRTERLISGDYAFCPPDAIPHHAPDTDDHAATVRRIEENAARMAELQGVEA